MVTYKMKSDLVVIGWWESSFSTTEPNVMSCCNCMVLVHWRVVVGGEDQEGIG